MGPTYIKIGQLLSGRADLLPDPYLKALARLQDKVSRFRFRRSNKLSRTNWASASPRLRIFQRAIPGGRLARTSPRAALRDGRAVVVKVQRPEIRQQIAEDFEVLEQNRDFF